MTSRRAQVHEHCWTVVRWAILAIGSGDSAARMLRFYSRLLEHFMGVDPRSPEEVRCCCTTRQSSDLHKQVRSVRAAMSRVATQLSIVYGSFCCLGGVCTLSRQQGLSVAMRLLQLAAPEEKDERKTATDADRAKRAIKARKKGRVSALVAEAADGAETDPESAATPVGSVAKAVMANGDGTGDDGGGSKVHRATLNIPEL